MAGIGSKWAGASDARALKRLLCNGIKPVLTAPIASDIFGKTVTHRSPLSEARSRAFDTSMMPDAGNSNFNIVQSDGTNDVSLSSVRPIGRDAREKLEDSRRHYNEDRPHSAIGYNVRSPCTFPVTQPARHRDQGRKTPISGGPEWGNGTDADNRLRQVSLSKFAVSRVALSAM